MKKLTVILISLLLVSGLAACGNSRQEQNGTSAPSYNAENKTEPQSQTAVEPETTQSSEGKTLVVYYSASGNTKEAADYIAAATNGDLFEIVPVEIYSNADLDWTNKDSRVSKEHNDVSARQTPLVADTVSDWESYDTVFIGYPIWWGIAAWPVDTFIKANDFTGKTVIPFCTSASSGLGESGELLKEMAGTGNWLEGERFRSGVSEETIRSWVEGLGL